MLADTFITTAPLVAAITTDVTVYCPAPPLCLGGKWAVREVGVVPNVIAAADASHYSTVTFSGSDGSTALGSLTTATVAFAVGTRRAATLTTTAATYTASTLTNAGVKVVKTHTGNGIAVNVQAYVVWEKIREV